MVANVTINDGIFSNNNCYDILYTRDQYKKNLINKYFNKTITTILYVESVKTIKTKNNEKMSFVLLSDEYMKIEGVIFPENYKKFGEIKKNKVYKIVCNVEKRNNNYQLIIYNIIEL